MKQPDKYTCNGCGTEDIPVKDITERTVLNQRPGEEDIFVQATLCEEDDKKLADMLESLNFVPVSKDKVLETT